VEGRPNRRTFTRIEDPQLLRIACRGCKIIKENQTSKFLLVIPEIQRDEAVALVCQETLMNWQKWISADKQTPPANHSLEEQEFMKPTRGPPSSS
jgi:hypothetical protein